MADKTVVEIVRTFFNLLVTEKFPVTGIVLYGSYARGDQRPDSDIDVIVLVDDSVPREDLRALWTKLDLLAFDVDSRIETRPIHESRFQLDDGSPLIYEARKEGIPIAA